MGTQQGGQQKSLALESLSEDLKTVVCMVKAHLSCSMSLAHVQHEKNGKRPGSRRIRVSALPASQPVPGGRRQALG